MFKEFRIKIVVVIISTLTVLFAGILIAIYVASYHKSNEYTNYMLRRLCNRDGFNILIKPKRENDYLNSSKYYLVLLGSDQSVLRLYNDNSSGYSDQELSELAISLLENENKKGTYNDFTYFKKTKNAGTYVAFSNDVFQNTYLDTLFINILTFGFLGLILLLLVSIWLSKWLITPLEAAFNKQKQFISDASHEIKTPLAIISSNADALEREVGNNKWLEYIQNETLWMNKLISNLLQLTTIDSYVDYKSQKKINFSEITKSIVLPFESITYEKQITLVDRIDDNMYIAGDSIQLGQLISILLDNAINHTEPGGTITVRLKKQYDKKLLSVANTGKEIPPSEQKLIFERFYRADKARTRGNGNYGLGLAIANAIIHRHNGKISVTCKNQITTFTVVL
jgi:signal transduction histidine kinase